MKRIILPILIFTLASGLRAIEDPNLKNFDATGHWGGFIFMVEDPNQFSMFELDICEQLGRRFDGMTEDGLNFKGTVAASGEYILNSLPGQPAKLIAQGNFCDFDGTGLAANRVELKTGKGSPFKGLSALLQAFGHMDWMDVNAPEIEGDWGGSAVSIDDPSLRILLMADFHCKMGSSVEGHFLFDDHSFDIVATINGDGKFRLLGKGPRGLILVMAGDYVGAIVPEEKNIRGTYRLFDITLGKPSDFDNLWDNPRLTIDRGTFSIEYRE